MKIMFCSDPLNSKVVDMEYEHEYRCARERIPTFDTPERFIYRGWMMKPQDYEQLYDALRQKNAFLINSPSEYRNGHYFPYSYGAIKKATPQSIWLEIGELANGFDVLFEKMRIFGNKASGYCQGLCKVQKA